MELAVATKQARVRGALIVASRQLLLLIVLSFGISYIIPACIRFASMLQVNDETRSSAFPSSSSKLTAELVCESAPPRLWRRSDCRNDLHSAIANKDRYVQ